MGSAIAEVAPLAVALVLFNPLPVMAIIVLHDGHHKNPRANRRYTVQTVDRLIPLLRQKGLEFGTICDAITYANHGATENTETTRRP